MDSKYFSVFNKTRQTYLSDQIRIVDAVLEPLKVLKVLIEGLDPRVEEGLWLTHFKGVPVARTLSPFDLIYLDKDYRVVHAVELTTDSDFAPFKGLPESALVLPPQSISSSGSHKGDLLILRVIEQRVPDTSRVAIPPPPQPVTQAGRSLRDLSPTTRFSNASFPLPSTQVPNPAVEALLPAHSSPSVHPAPTGRISKGPAELPLSAPLPSTTSPVPSIEAMQAAAAQPAPVEQPEVVEAPRRRAAQPGVVKPAKRRTPAPILPIHEKPVPPLRETSSAPPPALVVVPPPVAPPAPPPIQPQAAAQPAPVDRTEASPATPIFEVPRPQPSTVFAQAGIPLETIPLAPPPARLPLQPPSVYPAEPLGPLQPPSKQFTDYSDVVLPRQEETSRTVKWLRWLFPNLNIDQPALVTDRRKADRLPLPDLVAYFFTGGAPRPHPISNISITGFYMETEDRWIPGTIIRMTLQRIGSLGDDPGDTITVHSRVVRWGAQGGGFEFVFSGHLD